MKAIITVVGKDQVGIIAGIVVLLAAHQINVLDISQTIMDGYFTMIMMVDLSCCDASFEAMQKLLTEHGESKNLSIRIQREDIFNAMHKI